MLLRFAPLLLLFLSSCAPLSARAETRCEALDHEACTHSSECILDFDGTTRNAYSCRARHGKCETGLPEDQAARRAECASRKGCGYEGSCYCPCLDKGNLAHYQKCACVCGGGLPTDCRLEGSSTPPGQRH